MNIQNIYGKAINIDGNKLEPNKDMIVENSNEVKTLIKHKYIQVIK